ncbi:type II toxin-antitoxin system VapC family toxin [Microbacterium sp.]|uniref:type II toxin-antitoxin system VapC family toxin n=1 Tax=Microbacterium sp. TaxID=51671 RepID=UPI0039E21994
MSWLIDTNVVSELGKRYPDSAVLDWASKSDPLVSYLSAMTVFELERGVQRVERVDPAQGARMRLWLDALVHTEYVGRVLPMDAEVAALAASLHVPDPRPEPDAWIAATALRHNLTVVTRNVRDFVPLGVRVLNPWEG